MQKGSAACHLVALKVHVQALGFRVMHDEVLGIRAPVIAMQSLGKYTMNQYWDP